MTINNTDLACSHERFIIEEVELLVAFVDITEFQRISRRYSNTQTFTLISRLAEMICHHIHSHNGTIVKHIGDASLLYFSEEKVSEGITALWELKELVDLWLSNSNLPYHSKLEIKAHYGKVARGHIGDNTSGSLDIIGDTVNIAASLPGKGFVISPQVFRKLNPESRKRFKKHTPPITYIPIEQPH